jgi:hypothetical protein
MPQSEIHPGDRLVSAALLPDATKAAIRRAFVRRRAADRTGDLALSQAEIDQFDSTDISLQVGEVEAVVCVGVGKPSGLFRRRAKTFWVFVGERKAEHFFPVSSHATKQAAADMLIALQREFAEIKP